MRISVFGWIERSHGLVSCLRTGGAGRMLSRSSDDEVGRNEVLACHTFDVGCGGALPRGHVGFERFPAIHGRELTELDRETCAIQPDLLPFEPQGLLRPRQRRRIDRAFAHSPSAAIIWASTACRSSSRDACAVTFSAPGEPKR